MSGAQHLGASFCGGLAARLELTAAGRWNRTTVALRDQVPDGDLSDKHRFSRLNPMLGYSYTVARVREYR